MYKNMVRMCANNVHIKLELLNAKSARTHTTSLCLRDLHNAFWGHPFYALMEQLAVIDTNVYQNVEIILSRLTS